MESYQLPNKFDFEKVINGKKSHLIILKNKRGMKVAVSDYGARIVSILVPDNKGRIIDVVLGFNNIDDYLSATETYHGVTVGRFANRIANGTFKLEDKVYHIKPNNGPNALHGGERGFDKTVWDRRVNDSQKVEFYLVSPDGEEGFPGNLTVAVTYSISENNELIIKYRAHTDKTTVLNLTNHAFFNLNGEGEESIINHKIKLNADHYLPVDTYQIPTGELQTVEGTPFDFRELKSLSEALDLSNQQIKDAEGFDHNFILKKSTNGKIAAKVISPLTGIQLEVLTSEPGIQLYTGNFLNGTDIGKKGKAYKKHDAFCLETQKFPDSPNQPSFPTCILHPGEVFTSETRYRFSVQK
jgi:aldose 1-epimerase